MPPKVYKNPQAKNGSSRSRVVAARIDATQAYLLDRDYPNQKSAVFRALLRLLFNKKILNFDTLLQAEIANAEAAQLENLARFRDKLVEQKIEKESERANVLRAGSSSGKNL